MSVHNLAVGVPDLIHVHAVDAGGFPTDLPGPVSWVSSDPTIVSVAVAAASSSVTAIRPGSATLTATTPDPRNPGQTLSVSADVSVSAGPAAALVISWGTEGPQPNAFRVVAHAGVPGDAETP